MNGDIESWERQHREGDDIFTRSYRHVYPHQVRPARETSPQESWLTNTFRHAANHFDIPRCLPHHNESSSDAQAMRDLLRADMTGLTTKQSGELFLTRRVQP